MKQLGQRQGVQGPEQGKGTQGDFGADGILLATGLGGGGLADKALWQRVSELSSWLLSLEVLSAPPAGTAAVLSSSAGTTLVAVPSWLPVWG